MTTKIKNVLIEQVKNKLNSCYICRLILIVLFFDRNVVEYYHNKILWCYSIIEKFKLFVIKLVILIWLLISLFPRFVILAIIVSPCCMLNSFSEKLNVLNSHFILSIINKSLKNHFNDQY